MATPSLKAVSGAGEEADNKALYLETLALVERLHRRFLDVVKAELDRLGLHDINNVQSLILYNIGDDELTVGELTNRGYYLGSNVSYNLKKLVEHGYLEHHRSEHDRRTVRVRLTRKGLDLHARINALHERQLGAVLERVVGPDELILANASLRALERFWSDHLLYGA